MERKIPKPFSPDDVVAALLTFFPRELSNDPAKIHSTIKRLQEREEYRDLLEDFEFLDYYPYPYSPLLGRILNRLQESRLLASLNPGYEMYVIEDISREAIRSGILEKKLAHQRDKLEQIAEELKAALKC